MSNKVYNTANLQKMIKVCELARDNHWLSIVEGESGYGKSFTYSYFQEKNEESVYLIEMVATDKRKESSIWRRLLLMVLGEDFYYSKCEKASFEELTNYLVFGLTTKKNSLVIIDEGGFLSIQNLRYFRSLVDRTRDTTGYVISGPGYFVKKLNEWIAENKEGIQELETRIDLIITLTAPTYKEKMFICEKEGVEGKANADAIAKKSSNYRALFREIDFYRKDVKSRYVSEWS